MVFGSALILATFVFDSGGCTFQFIELIFLYLVQRQWLQDRLWIFKFDTSYLTTSCNVIVTHDENAVGLVDA